MPGKEDSALDQTPGIQVDCCFLRFKRGGFPLLSKASAWSQAWSQLRQELTKSGEDFRQPVGGHQNHYAQDQHRPFFIKQAWTQRGDVSKEGFTDLSYSQSVPSACCHWRLSLSVPPHAREGWICAGCRDAVAPASTPHQLHACSTGLRLSALMHDHSRNQSRL